MRPTDPTAAKPERRSMVAHWLIFVVTSLALLFLFGEITEEVIERHTAPIDEPVRSWVIAHRTPTGGHVFWVLTQFGSVAATVAIGHRCRRVVLDSGEPTHRRHVR